MDEYESCVKVRIFCVLYFSLLFYYYLFMFCKVKWSNKQTLYIVYILFLSDFSQKMHEQKQGWLVQVYWREGILRLSWQSAELHLPYQYRPSYCSYTIQAHSSQCCTNRAYSSLQKPLQLTQCHRCTGRGKIGVSLLYLSLLSNIVACPSCSRYCKHDKQEQRNLLVLFCILSS